MKIVLIHYHLKTGGVTTVIKQQIEAIQNECQVLVITGESPQEALPVDTAIVKGLAYDIPSMPTPDPTAVSAEIMGAIRDKWAGICDIVHVHNPTLAKNKHLLSTLKRLQSKGIKLLLQIHDFAEDGRPHVYYPEAYVSDCHYAVINSRDYQYLLKAGLSPTGLHLLPNSVSPMPAAGSKAGFKNQVLYPVRAIRRKNIGEAILISLFFKEGERLAITLPPNSISDVASYDGWRQFVEELRLNVDFEVGLQADFSDLLRSARYILTTSIAEGFGFSFLEPWLADNILWGRNLSEICQDFKSHGIQLDHLYDTLSIPLGWIDSSVLYRRWINCIQKTARSYQISIDLAEIEQEFESITADDDIDFGMLDEFHQKKIIRRIVSDPSDREQLCRLNPFLKNPGVIPKRDLLCRHNRYAALSHYGQKMLKQRLIQTYERVTAIPVKHCIDKPTLLNLFMRLERFSLLNWCPYAEPADI